MDRARLRTIVALGLPIIGGMISQNVFNLVDTAMVGVLGSDALAGVGVAGFLNFMAIAALMGVAAGVQAMVARRHGAGEVRTRAMPLNAGLWLSLLIGVPGAVVLIWASPFLFPVVNADPAVAGEGVPYMQARLAALTAVGANFAFRGYWTGINRPMLYLRTLLVMHFANVVLNYILIFGALGFPALGTFGAGLGTAIAAWLGAAIYLGLGWRHARSSGFLRGLPDAHTALTVLRLGVPAGIQQFLFATGFTALFWIIGQIGTREVAASNVLVNLALVVILPGIGFGVAAASLVGQALGRRDPSDAQRWGWDVTKVAAVVMAALGLPMVALPDLILSGFIHEPETLAMARLPLRLIGLVTVADAALLVLMHGLRGAGATQTAMVASVATQWGLFLPVAWVIGTRLELGLTAVWICYGAYRVVAALILMALWRSGRWQGIRL